MSLTPTPNRIPLRMGESRRQSWLNFMAHGSMDVCVFVCVRACVRHAESSSGNTNNATTMLNALTLEIEPQQKKLNAKKRKAKNAEKGKKRRKLINNSHSVTVCVCVCVEWVAVSV